MSRSAIAAATIGNGLEFYDFITFTFFSIQIGQAFFPTGNAFTSLMGALATFGAGFVTRPLGAWVLGTLADRVGRKPAMLLSFALMGSAIVLLALTPGYASIGVAAPLIAILARLVQGFALGGEVGSATAYLLEMAPLHRRGFAASWQGASQGVAATIGASMGLVLTALLPHDLAQAYAWRIALLLGALTVPFGLWVRNRIPETLDLDEQYAAAPPAHGARPYLKVIVLGLIIIGAGTTSTYIFHYMATFGQATLHLSESVSFTAVVVNSGVLVVTVLTGGWLSDRYGRKPVMVGAMLPFAVMILPMFLWLTTQRDAVSFITANFLLSTANGFIWGAFLRSFDREPAQAHSHADLRNGLFRVGRGDRRQHAADHRLAGTCHRQPDGAGLVSDRCDADRAHGRTPLSREFPRSAHSARCARAGARDGLRRLLQPGQCASCDSWSAVMSSLEP